MSFNDEYLKLRKKRLEEESRNGKAKTNNNVLLDTLFSKASSDIAPVRLTEQEQWMASSGDKKWYQKFFKGSSLFDDGYQFGDVSKAAGASVADLGVDILKGAGRLVEGVTDLVGHGVAGVADLFGQEEWSDSFRDDVNKSWVDEVAAPTDEYLNNYSVLGSTSDAVGEGLGQVAAIILTGGALGAAGASAAGITAGTTGLIGASSMGSGMSEAYLGGATDKDALKYGALKGAIDAGTELIFGGLGKTVKSLGLSHGLTSLDDMLAKGLSSKISNRILHNLVELGVKASAEGLEEVLAGWGTAVAKKFSYMSEEELSTLIQDEDLLEQFIVGAVTSGIAQSGLVPGTRKGSFIDTVKQDQDFVTRLDYTEEAVINKVYNDRVLEAEQDGKKLSAKEQNQIYEDVLNDLEKGRIDTDAIEAVWGGGGAATEMMVKGTKLAESYNEKARRGQAFQANVTQYAANQRDAIQKAIASGVLNNTNRTHEFVDLIAKISADKGVSFDFTNNKKLKESGFAINGADVNAYINNGGITLNIDSHKAWQSTVGHEITHVLEGTELYAEMQRVLFDYAKSKGDYQGRYDSLIKLYKGVKGANIDAELTADLVGDYLFTDENFVKHLSSQNRNIFQKIYDEIKYLWKLVTAGSKEARDLERVKHAFDKAYKESGKASEGTKYSATYKKTIDKYSQKQYNDFGWAREADAVTKNELDDMYSKIHEKGSLKKFLQTSKGEAIIEVNDNPHTTLGTDNVFVFVTGTTNNPQISKVVRFEAETETEMEIIKEKLYERGSFSNSYYSFLKQYGFAREYSKKSALDYIGYEEKARRRSSGADSNQADGNSGVKRNRSWPFEETQSNDIAPTKASSTDGVFFDGKKQYSLSANKKANTAFDERLNNVSAVVDKVYNDRLIEAQQGGKNLSTKAQNKIFNQVLNELKEGNIDTGTIEEVVGYENLHDVATNTRLGKSYTKKWEKISQWKQTVEGLTKDEKAVVDKVFNDRLSKSKKQLSTDEQKKIYYKVVSDLENGNLDTRTIMEVVGTNKRAESVVHNTRLGESFRKKQAAIEKQEQTIASLTKDEKAVVDKIYSDRLFKAEQGGKKPISDEKKGELYSKVVNDLVKGNLDTQTIVEVIGTKRAMAVAHSTRLGESFRKKQAGIDQRRQDIANVIAPDTRYSLSDSDGKQLTKEQAEYFKDSKVVDANGNLKVMYHGTPNGDFSIFKDGTYFTEHKWYADRYQNPGASSISTGKVATNPKTFEVYLDIKKPFDINDAEARSIYINDYIKGGNAVGVNPYLSDAEYRKIDTIDWTEGEDLREFLIDNGYDYDGLVLDEGAVGGYGENVTYRGKSYVVFSPEQVKNVDNRKPTRNADIRYSLSEANKDYLSALKRGDNETAQQMIDDAAENAGYNLQMYYQPDGKDIRVWCDIGGKQREAIVHSLHGTPYGIPTEMIDENRRFGDNAHLTLYVKAKNTFIIDNRAEVKKYLPDLLPYYDEMARIDEKYSALTKELGDAETDLLNNWGDEHFQGEYPDLDYLPIVERLSEGKPGINSPEYLTAYNKRARLMEEWKTESNKIAAKCKEIITELLRNNGYDSIYFKGDSSKPDNFILLDANQIKSGDTVAYDNNGKYISLSKRFNTGKNDIRYSLTVDNDKQPETSGLSASRSLTKKGDTPKRYGNYYTPLKELKIDKSIKKSIEGTNTQALINRNMVNANKEEELIAPIADDYAPIGNVGGNVTKNVVDDQNGTKKKRGFIYGLKKSTTKARTHLVDNYSVFEDLALKTGNRELDAKANFMRYSEQRAQHFIGHGADGVRALEDLRKEVKASGLDQEFQEYMYDMHNTDRMSLEKRAKSMLRKFSKQFKELKPERVKAIAAKSITAQTTAKTAQTIRDARQYLNLLELRNKPVRGEHYTAEISQANAARLEALHPQFKEWAQDIYKINDYLRAKLVEDGEISQETADLWAEIYPHYVPIRRLDNSGAAVGEQYIQQTGLTGHLDEGNNTGVNAPIKRATGGSSDIDDLFRTLAMRAEQTYKAGAKNRFGLELKDTLATTINRSQASFDEMVDGVETHEERLKKGENGTKSTFTVFENGERVEFEITDEMYEALQPANDLFSGTNKVLNATTKFQRGVLTQYNPFFTMRNIVKDAQDVFINSQHAAKTYAKMPTAISELAKHARGASTKWAKEYFENGGEQNTYFDGQELTFKKEDATWKKVLGFVPRKISAISNFVERAPRLAEYIASREAGKSIEGAMLDSARVTTNFAAGGDVTKWANRNGFTFLNASIQGAAQQVRNVREAKANGLKGMLKLGAKFVAAGLPFVLLNSLMWDDDDDYEELSDYVKENYYIVAKYGDGQFVRIPKGRAMAVIQNAFEQMGNLITGDDEVDLERFGQLLVENLAPNNPLENNVFAPVMDAFDNKTWYGDDLVPTRLQDLPAAEQYDETTDSISKWIGENTDTSPYKWNYLLDQYSGVLGDMFLPMFTPQAESGDNSRAGNLIAPLKDQFTTDSVFKNQNVSDFYDTVDELAKNANSSYATDDDILKYKYMNSVNADLSELYKQKREIQNSNLADAEKYEAVREIQKQIDELTEDSLNTYGNVNIDGVYATVGNSHFRWYEPSGDSEAEPGWQKISDTQLAKQQEVTSGLGISPATYWNNKSEYDFAYEYPGRYGIAKSVGGYENYKYYASDLYDIKADKDANGKTITGSRKEKVADYINGLDISYEEKIILFKSEYTADDTYNHEIIDYLNNREDISYDEMVAILQELGFTVKGNTVTWD